MKVIRKENFESDLVMVSGLSEIDAEKECERLNGEICGFTSYFHCVEPEDYQPLTLDRIHGW
jgi:hypothetical protein